MPNIQEYPHFEKVLLIGRGLEPNGTAIYDSKVSGDTFDRGATLGQYAASHAETLQLVVASGAHTFVLDAIDQTPAGSEAEAAITVATANELPGHIEHVIEKNSKTTYGNFLRTAAYFQPDETIGLVVHRDHSKRALKIGKKVLPEVTFSPIFADNPARQNANATARIGDVASTVLYGIAMSIVRKGDLAAIDRHDKWVQKVVSSALRLQTQLSGKLSRSRATS